MQKLFRNSKLSCSKPFITLLKQQISNCCTVKKSHGHCYSHKSSVVVCTFPPVGFFTVQQFDICCFRSVMRGLLQLSSDKNKCDTCMVFFRFMNLFEVVVKILISQLLRGSTPLARNARSGTVNFCVFDHQKALPYL